MNILEEANKATSTDRQKHYGHPSDNFNAIAEGWNTYLNARPEPLSEITTRDVAMMMIITKVMRDANMPKRDNLVDAAGYARTAEMLDEV